MDASRITHAQSVSSRHRFRRRGGDYLVQRVGLPPRAIPAQVVDRGEVDGDAVEVGGLETFEQTQQDNADHDAVSDHDERLARMASQEFLEDGEDPAADIGEGFASGMGELQIPGTSSAF